MRKTHPLTEHEAAVVANLISEITTRHPGVTGVTLKGSAWNPAHQLPEADIDLNWCGQADAALEDPLMGFRAVFTRDGVLIDLATWFWSDLGKPESSSLATAVSLARSTILWERDGAFSVPRRAVRRLLADRAWVSEKLDNDFSEYRRTLTSWQDPAARNPFGHNWDFARQVCNVWGLAALSCLLLRPPSAGRKGLMEIVDCANRLDVPWYGDTVLHVMGATDITPNEAASWIERGAELLQDAEALHAGLDLGQGYYYLAGIRAMVERGCHREAVWPYWRVTHTLARELAATPLAVLADETAHALRVRTGLVDDGAISARLPWIADAIDRLYAEIPRLLERYFAELPMVSATWKD